MLCLEIAAGTGFVRCICKLRMQLDRSSGVWPEARRAGQKPPKESAAMYAACDGTQSLRESWATRVQPSCHSIVDPKTLGTKHTVKLTL